MPTDQQALIVELMRSMIADERKPIKLREFYKKELADYELRVSKTTVEKTQPPAAFTSFLEKYDND